MGGCIRDTVEVDRDVGSITGTLRCFGLEFVPNIFCPEFHQSRHLAKTKLQPEYPLRKKMNPALKQKISVFCEPQHPKKHATLR